MAEQPSGRRGRITTFYSYKGGTGRTMLLANAAWLLAEAGRRVLIIDWDLEAPGLHRYFAPFLTDPELQGTDGLIDMVVTYAEAAIDPGAERGDEWYLEYADVLNYTTSVNWRFAGGGSITLLPAGRQGSAYAARINTFNWKHFYDKLGGHGFFEHVKEGVRGLFDEVLLDSRTGVSDTAGICTVQWPDRLVVCFTLNNQSIEGASGVARSALAQRPSGGLVTYPIPMRIEQSESERLRKRWAMARERFGNLIEHLGPERRERYWDTVQLPYFPLYAYEEVLSPFANLPSDPANTNLLLCAQRVTHEVFGVAPKAPQIDETQRLAVVQAFTERSAAPLAELPEAATQPASEPTASRADSVLSTDITPIGTEARAAPTPAGGLGRPHAFVAMPFGTKPGPDGYPIDFDRIYLELYKPALEAAGCEVFRADQELRAGDIRSDAFQEMLLADVVLFDLTLDTPNVWYELGVRHALRARGVLLAHGPRRSESPFDIYTDRKLRYALLDGAPDPARQGTDSATLASMARLTLEGRTRRKVSPVFLLLPSLPEPDWRALLLGERTEFSASYEVWRSRIAVARQRGRVGDVLVLAGEVSMREMALEARLLASGMLTSSGKFDFALEQLDIALEIDPDNKPSREKKAVCLGRLGLYEEAREWTRRLTEDYPRDADVWSLAGSVEKDNWIHRWRSSDGTPAQMREAASAELASLEEAIAPYHQAFIADPAHFYSGINSLTLHLLLEHLGGAPNKTVVDNLVGGVLWASLTAQERDKKDYWARASYAELCLLVNAKEAVVREYRTAVAAANRDWFALDSTRQTLELLRDLEFRPDETAAALAIVDAEIRRATLPFEPRQVILFSGHIMDAPDRTAPRFPADKEAAAAQKIAQALDALGAGNGDLALCQAAAGGDLLFLEACVRRGVRCQVLLPFEEPEFIEQSVLPATHGAQWRDRYFALKAQLKDAPRIMADELGPLPKGVNPYERCNLWLLYTALGWGTDKVRFVCLWNGSGGDGPGGTKHMHDEVKRRTGRVTWIDTRTL